MNDKIDKFIKYLITKREDTGMMAALRRGFSKGTEYRAWPYISPWCNMTNPRERSIYLTVAAGFGFCKDTTYDGNMGTVFYQIAKGKKPGQKAMESFDSRFRRCLSCDTAEEICSYVPAIIKAANRKNIAVNFSQLLKDLTFWGEQVKVEWASKYWASMPEIEEVK